MQRIFAIEINNRRGGAFLYNKSTKYFIASRGAYFAPLTFAVRLYFSTLSYYPFKTCSWSKAIKILFLECVWNYNDILVKRQYTFTTHSLNSERSRNVKTF